jgi:hypothetical protein
MTRLRRIMGTALLWAMPRRVKEARIDRALRRMTRSFSTPWPGRFNATGYEVTPSEGDPLLSLPGR